MPIDLTDRLDEATKAAQTQRTTVPIPLKLSAPGSDSAVVPSPPSLGGGLSRVMPERAGLSINPESSGSGQQGAIYTAPDGSATSTHRGSQENQQGIADAQGLKSQLANMQRMRLETDAFDPSITDPSVRDSARSALLNMGATQKLNADIENNAIRAGIDKERLGLEGRRVDIAQTESARLGDKWGIDKAILQGQAADSQLVRTARAELNTAIASGDPAKVEIAKAKAVAAGVKFDKPNNEFTAVTDSMGMNVTRTNKDTGAVDIINPKTGEVKSIPAPGQQKAVAAPVPAGYTVIGTSGGKRVLQDAKGNRVIEGAN